MILYSILLGDQVFTELHCLILAFRQFDHDILSHSGSLIGTLLLEDRDGRVVSGEIEETRIQGIRRALRKLHILSHHSLKQSQQDNGQREQRKGRHRGRH